jgi:hypothetical protein
MPRPAIGIVLRIGRLRQRPMRVSPLGQGSRLVDGGARQGVPEAHAIADRQQALRLHLLRGRRRDPEPLGRAPEQQRIPERLGRRDQQQAPGVIRKPLELPDEALLDVPREVLRAEEAEATGQLGRRQPLWQLEQRERIPARLGDDPVADLRIQREPHRRVQQRAGVLVAQAVHHELGKVLELLDRLARGEHDPDRLRQQATGDEGERQCRRVIEPLRVIDCAQQRTLVGHFREQA